MAAPVIKTYTAEEYLSDKSFPECCELIKGVIFENLAAPNTAHQELAGNIYYDIKNYIRRNKGKCKPFFAPSDVKLNDDTVVQPDIYVTCRPELLDKQKLNGAPDWIIEIVSPFNRMHDYATKVGLYYSAGVREYWIIDPEKKKVSVYVWDEENKDINIYSFDEDIPVWIYKDSEEKLIINLSGYNE